jgi:hypothetical protein
MQNESPCPLKGRKFRENQERIYNRIIYIYIPQPSCATYFNQFGPSFNHLNCFVPLHKNPYTLYLYTFYHVLLSIFWVSVWIVFFLKVLLSSF